jgi:hypothetical protein
MRISYLVLKRNTEIVVKLNLPKKCKIYGCSADKFTGQGPQVLLSV